MNNLFQMSYSDDLWELSHYHHSYESIHIFQQPQIYNQPSPNSYQQFLLRPQLSLIENPCHMQCQIFFSLQGQQQSIYHRIDKIGSNKMNSNVVENNRINKIKPSPYHNYQKHLNTTLRQLIIFPTLQPNSHISIYLASKLWNIFIQSQCSTKKILHFIFNQFNQYRIKNEQLNQFGFAQTYSSYSKQILGQAKTYLTHMAIDQMNDQNIDYYLQHRRIKNPQKFKKYLMVFKKELEDGFLKKRFTNRNRKQKIRKEHIGSQ